jgi:hypothetical protein
MSEMPPLEILVQRIQLSPGVIALNWADKSREEEVLELQASWKGGSMVSKLEDQQPQLPITALPLHCTSLRLRLKVLKPNDLIEGYGGWRFSSTASTTAEIPLLRTEVGEEPDGLLLRFDAPMIVREPERPPWLSDDLTVHGRLDAPDGDIPATEVILYVNSTPDQPQTVRESSVVWTSMVRLGGPPRLIKADGTFSFFLDARAFNVKGSGFTPEELFNIARTHGLVVGTNLSGPKPVISPFIIPLIQIPFAALSDPIILNVEKN